MLDRRAIRNTLDKVWTERVEVPKPRKLDEWRYSARYLDDQRSGRPWDKDLTTGYRGMASAETDRAFVHDLRVDV